MLPFVFPFLLPKTLDKYYIYYIGNIIIRSPRLAHGGISHILFLYFLFIYRCVYIVLPVPKLYPTCASQPCSAPPPPNHVLLMNRMPKAYALAFLPFSVDEYHRQSQKFQILSYELSHAQPPVKTAD